MFCFWKSTLNKSIKNVYKCCDNETPTTSPSPKMGVPYAPRYANGHVSATGDAIHFMFGSRVEFSGSADGMALFPVTSNPSCDHPCDSTAFLFIVYCKSSSLHSTVHGNFAS